MSNFTELFQHSPFDPLRQHMAKVMECVSLLKPMLEAARDGDHGKLEQITKDVFKVEHEADQIKDEIRQTIPKTFFLPVYRGDLLGDLKLQDDMADSVEDVAVLLTIKKLVMPKSLHDEVFEYADAILDTCQKAKEVSDYLPKALADGFDREGHDNVLGRVAEVEKAEWISDRIQYKLSKSLFALEDELKATDIFLWFRVFGEMGQLANAAEKTADRVRRMMASH